MRQNFIPVGKHIIPFFYIKKFMEVTVSHQFINKFRTSNHISSYQIIVISF